MNEIMIFLSVTGEISSLSIKKAPFCLLDKVQKVNDSQQSFACKYV